MKLRMGRYSLVVVALTLPFTGGCLQEKASSAKSSALASNAEAKPTETVTKTPAPVVDAPAVATAPAAPAPAPVPATAPLAEVSEVPMDEDGIVTAEVRPISWHRELPPSVQTNALVGEIIKLADAGVDENVMLAFANHSTSLFNLTADQIIYLNDIGIPDTVVAAMLQRDQELRGTGAAAPNLTTVWSETADANTSAETLAPADMAPQPTAPVAEAAPAAAPEAAPPPSQVTYNTFYSSLAPYGTWVEVEGYGRCWQPSVVVVNPGWQPYLHGGRWIYTDCGWYWYSDYTWGWAPFHYGRWFRHYRLGWCWYPDVYWGPSWVTWRYSGAYCGWAPLPPAACYYPGVGITWWGSSVSVSFGFGLYPYHYSYVSWNNFKHHKLHHYAVPKHQRDRVHREAVSVTRIEGNRNAANRGLPVDRVSAATRTEIKPVTLTEVRTPPAGGRTRPERLSTDGTRLAVYRPNLPDTPRELPPAVQRNRTAPRNPDEVAANRTPPSRNVEQTRGVPTTSTAERRTPGSVNAPTRTPPVLLDRPIPARTLAQTAPPAVRTPERTATPDTARTVDTTPPRRNVADNPGLRRGEPYRPSVNTPQTVTRSAPARIDSPDTRRPTTPPIASTPEPLFRRETPGRSTTPALPQPRPQVTQPATRSAVETPRSAPLPRTQTIPGRSFETPRVSVPQTPTRTAPTFNVPQTSIRSTPAVTPPAAAPSPTAPTVRNPRPVEVPRYTPTPGYTAPQRSAPTAPTPSYTPPSVAPRTVTPQPSRSPQSSFNRSAPSAPSAPSVAPAPRSFSAPPAAFRNPGGGGGNSPRSGSQGGGGNSRSSGDRAGR